MGTIINVLETVAQRGANPAALGEKKKRAVGALRSLEVFAGQVLACVQRSTIGTDDVEGVLA
ncbi:hypothetical protein D3C71_2103110 [compost metagenome]